MGIERNIIFMNLFTRNVIIHNEKKPTEKYMMKILVFYHDNKYTYVSFRQMLVIINIA